MHRAVYGLRTSGSHWHDRFAANSGEMGYSPCNADPDIWLKDTGTHYEYVCVYVDVMMMAGKNPLELFDDLTNKYSYKLKGVVPPSYHLGGDLFCDSDGTHA